MKNIDNILYPNEAFEFIKNDLISYYINSYGEEYEEKITNNINDTSYIFESNPIDTYDFIKKYNIIYPNLDLLIEEYVDYKYESNLIDKILKEKLYNKYNIDYDLYKNQRSLNFNSKINNYIKNLSYIRETYLVNNTIWGKRILRDLKKYNNLNISSKLLAYHISNHNPVVFYNRIDKKLYNKALYLPLISNLDLGNLDRMLYHELRHVVETGSNMTGFDDFTGDYLYFNEIRIDKNSFYDYINLSNYLLFSNDNKDPSVEFTYPKLFKYTSNFFEKYNNLLNDLGIQNNLFTLNALFGEKNIINYEKFLSKTLNICDTKHSNDLEEQIITRSKKLIKRMEDKVSW